MFIVIRTSVIIAFFITSLPLLANGNEDPLSTKGVSVNNSDIEVVTISGSYYRSDLSKVKHALDTIKQDDISALNAKHPAEIFSLSANILISQGSGQEHLSAIRSPVFTGAGACSAFYVAQNNLSLRAPGFCNANQLFDSHFEVAKSVDVFKGPFSSRYGGQALFGGINIELPTATEYNNNKLSFERGSHQLQRINLITPFSAKNHDFTSFLTHTNTDSFRHGAEYQQTKWSLSHETDYQDKNLTSSFTITDLAQDTAGYIYGENSYLNETIRNDNENPEAYRKAQSLKFYSNLNWHEGRHYYSITPYFRRNKMSFLMHFLPGQPTEDNQHSSVGMNAHWRYERDGDLQVIAGSAFDYTQGKLHEYQQHQASFAVDKYPIGDHYHYQVEGLNLAAFLAVQWQLNELLSVEISHRYDYQRYDYKNRLTKGSACEANVDCRYYRPANSIDKFNSPSSKLSLSYQLDPELVLFSSWGRAFRAPHTSELYRLQHQQKADNKTVKTDGVEVGIRGTANDINWQLVSFYMSAYDNIFLNSERQYVNGSDSIHRGLEFDINLYQGQKFSINNQFSYNKHTYANNPALLGNKDNIKGNDIDTAPRKQGRISLKYQLSEHLRFGLSHIMQGGYFLTMDNSTKYRGHQTTHLNVNYMVNHALTMRLNITNLFDKKYANRADYAFGEYRYFPADLRNVSLTLDYAW